MAFKHLIVAALALAMVSSHPVDSGRDQYKHSQDSKATDPKLQVGESEQRTQRRIVRNQPPISKTDKYDAESEEDLFGQEEEKRESSSREIDAGRRKRGYARWENQKVASYQPAKYQITRPYYIPVYGAPGKIPLFFPPQSLNLNPGFPIDNPPRRQPFKGSTYLPPVTSRPAGNTTMGVGNRFGVDDDDDDRPVWGNIGSTSSPTRIIPTRAPRPALADFPPLVHDNGGTNRLSADDEYFVPLPQNNQRPTRPPAASAGPSNCVWAIISCCSALSPNVPDSCFEQRGCPGPFWGSSPCESDFARAAIASALNYYNA